MSKPRLVDLVGLCWLKTKLSEKNMLGYVLIVDLDYFFSWGLSVETKFISQNKFKLLLVWVLTILALS